MAEDNEPRSVRDLAHYYARRAAEYERIYAKPERQADLRALATGVAGCLDDKAVLELACGTGYWTRPVAARARSVVGVDINEEVLAIARAKPYTRGNVRFVCADLYAGGSLGGPFDAALAAHWWSHVLRADTARFLEALHRHLLPGALVVLLDNRYVEGSSTPIARTDDAGNTYQVRTLDDGSQHEVLKNFPDAAAMRAALAGRGEGLSFREYPYYWLATYRVLREPGAA